jgi:GT2 family glycosyltransferase
MILFIAPYPDPQNEQDGMMQRISTVDKIFQKEKRVYASITPYNSDVDFISEELKIYQINFSNNLHINKLKNLILQSRFIYVHSIYNAQYILPFYKYKKVITDMHGVVPEEVCYYSRKRTDRYFENIEKFVIHNSYLIINVSESMAEHFKNKYPDLKTGMMTLPILDTCQANRNVKIIDKDKITIIYSGGIQRWQNIDLMIESIVKVKDKFKFVILTKDKEELKNKINTYELDDIVEIKSVSKEKIDEYYYKSDFGFILRDDIVINRVACPTKLTEYMTYGIIPIVIQPHIGDFKELGYSYLTLDDFINGNIPSWKEIENIRNNNYKVIEKLENIFNSSIKKLLELNTEISLNMNSEIYLTSDEIINQGLRAQLFINTGSNFNEDQSIIKDISGNECLLEFDISKYRNIKGLRFDPINDRSILNIKEINIITEDNILYSKLPCQTNALYKKDNIFIFETNDPIIDIDIKEIVNPVKVIVKLEYITCGKDVYKYISEEKSFIIKTKDDSIIYRDEQIRDRDEQIRDRDEQIRDRDEQIRDRDEQIKHKDLLIENQNNRIKLLSEKENILNNIYNSHGWKILLTYYKLRDFLLPENSVKRRLVKSLFKLPYNLKKRLRNIIIKIDHIELKYDFIEIAGWALSHNSIGRIEVYIDDKFINNAAYGLIRPDVEKEYYFIKNSVNSGFHLYINLNSIYTGGSSHIVKIKGIDGKNKSKEIIIPLISTGLTRPKITVDKIELYNDKFYISGWAISEDTIDKVEIYMSDKFMACALHGQNRPDVKTLYPSINNSEKSGFYLSKSIKNLKENLKEYNIKVKVITSKGHFTELTSNVIQKNLWSDKNEPDKNELERQKNIKFKYEPKISIITPAYNTPEQFLIDMIESVLEQTYSNWELCIADGNSNENYVKELLQSYANKDKRIKIKLLTENKGIAGNSNEALSLATGDFITLLDHDDTLTPFALFEIVKVINDHSVDFIYSDEDKITEDGKRRFDRHFKPDWSQDTLRSYNYPIHVSVFRKEIIEQIGGFREGFEGSQDYDLILRATEKAKKIIHIPQVLYHWRSSINSTAGHIKAKLYACDSAKKALEEHLKRTGLKGEVKDGLCLSTYQITYDITKNPKISIIIPNKDHYKDLDKCINSIINKSSYRNFEIIIVENGSKEENTFKFYKELKERENVKIIEWNKSFNYAAINNFAVNHSEGEILLFLNNDMEIINPDWLERMLEHVIRKEIGAAGAKLYYPDNTIQHGGVIIGIQGAAGHAHKNFNRNNSGYFARLMIIQNLSAVTAACLMMRKEVFREIEGFDERYTVAFNDVDLCLKLREKNYLIIWTPYAELYHYESETRGLEDTPEKQERAKKEVDLLKLKWKGIFEKGDPYYNPNLTLDKEDFSLKYD